MRPRAYDNLRNLAVELSVNSERGQRWGPAYTFDDVGLILKPEVGREGNDFTPVNVDTFASTGGDGVHFSLLLLDDGRSIDDAPVVMTVPMAFENANRIVGDNFLDFLALGCRYGYFALEQLAYNFAGTVRDIEDSPGPDPSDSDARLLDAIRDRFRLHPWTDVAAKLARLEEQYKGLIQLGPWVNDL